MPITPPMTIKGIGFSNNHTWSGRWSLALGVGKYWEITIWEGEAPAVPIVNAQEHSLLNLTEEYLQAPRNQSKGLFSAIKKKVSTYQHSV